MCVFCVYAAIAKKREDFPKTRKQRLAQHVACLYVEEYKQFRVIATEAQMMRLGGLL